MEIARVEHYDDRFYKITRNNRVDYYPSVTTKLGIIAKPFLASWRGDIGNREANLRMFEASERGTRIHSAWERLCKNGMVVFNDRRKPIYTKEDIERFEKEFEGNVDVIRYQDEMVDLCKLKEFISVFKLVIESSEFTVFSDTYREAGTIDNTFLIQGGDYYVNSKKPIRIRGGRYIGDLKTGSMIDDNAYMQTASYANAYEEMGLGKVDGTIILHTGSKSRMGIKGFSVEVREKDEMDQDFKDFRNASALWERKNKDLKPELFEFPSILTLKEVNKNGKSNTVK